MNLRLQISKKQREFLDSKSKGTIFRAGIGSGKSRILCYKAIQNALQGRRELIVSFSFPMLRDVILHTLLEVMPLFGLVPGENCQVNKTEMTITIGGSQILLRSGDAPDSIRGLNVHDFFIDEGRNFKTDDIFLICLGRIRNVEDSQWFISSSPRGKDWMYDLATDDPEVNLIVQKTEENPFLPDGYIKELRKRYSAQFARQELEASIVELGAGVIDPAWFNVIERKPLRTGCRFWDLAVSVKTSADFTAGALCSFQEEVFTIENILHGKLSYPDLKKLIVKAAEHDGRNVIIGIEQAGQQLGFIDDLRRDPRLRPYVIRAVRPEGDKLNRALAWSLRAESGLVNVVRGNWNKVFYDECLDFTADDTHLHDDQIDAVSGAYQVLSHKVVVTAGRVAI